MADTVPPWLATMREFTGIQEFAGGSDNPVIIAWGEEIAARFPRMADYARSYKHDATAWCGLTVAVCMARNGIEPPYNSNDDYKSFLWVDAWADWGAPVQPGQERLGDVLVFSSPHHVTIFDGQEAFSYFGRGGNQSDGVNVKPFAKSGVNVIRRPPAPGAIAPTKFAARRYQNIWATVFADPDVAYQDVAPGWSDRPGVALPAWFSGPRPRVRVINEVTRKGVVCEIVDQGPWNYTSKTLGKPGDPYWVTGMRPQAESGIDMNGRPTNLAGIDLTPAAARAIGLDGKGLVDWEFVAETFIQPPDTSGKPMPPDATPSPIDDCQREVAAAMRPVLEKYLKPAPPAVPLSPDGLAELLRKILGGVAAVAPAIAEPVKAEPVPPAVPLSPGKIDFRAGLLGFLGSLGLSAAGVVGAPVGPDATLTGMLLPLAGPALAAMGVPAPLLGLLQTGLSLLAGKLAKR